MGLQEKNKLKILIHHPRLSYYIGGGEIIPLIQAEVLSSFGHHVEILTSRNLKFSPIFKDFCRNNPQIKLYYIELSKKDKKIYREIPGNGWKRWDKESILFGKRAIPFYLANRNRWDVVITHLLSDSLFIPKSFTNILHLHGVPSKTRRWDYKLLQRPNGFIAVAKFVKKRWISLYPFLKRKKIIVAYNGIQTEKFPNLHLKKNIDLLFVGRLLKNKGIETIIKSLNFLMYKKIHFNNLIIVGQGPEEKNIKKQIKELNLTKKVKIIPFVTHKYLVSLYNRSKIFLCPSTSKEGVLTTMLEAACCKAAIITTNCCGMVEFAKDNINALLIKPFDTVDLARKIEILLKNEEIRNRLINNAEKMVRKYWDAQKTCKKLEAVYLKFVRNHNYDNKF